jgi:hypothetical protein
MLGLTVLSLVVGLVSATHPASHIQSLTDQWQDKANGPGICIALHCGLQVGSCVIDPQCFDALQCLTDCEGQEDEMQCQFECEMTLGNGNEHFENLLRCMAANGCFPEGPPDGLCLATEADTVQEITSIEDVAGSWWVVRGVNCGQDGWPGAYDWYPCQRARYVIIDDDWVNNTTYCGGHDSVCTTDTIVTIPQATMPSPGLIRLEYMDEPLLPQIERWHIVSKPSDDFMMVMWCGSNPALNYNGGFVVARERTEVAMTPEIEAEFRRVAENLGVDYDAMCLTDNTNCDGEP